MLLDILDLIIEIIYTHYQEYDLKYIITYWSTPIYDSNEK